MRVTFYARVSTDKDEQINSLENQISYYKDLIQKNTNWTYVEGYIDEGLSGMSTTKRISFNRMIDDAKNGKFDFIITKEITRFARNTVDSITFTRDLLSYGVAILFQNDGINTIDEDSELRLTIMSGIAQDELRKLSSRIKFGHKQSIKSGVVMGNSRIFGYQKNSGKLVIDESESNMVKELFQLYSTGQYSMNSLEKYFWGKGIRNTNGKKLSHSTMANIIRNPKYKGFYVGGKVQIDNMFSKKQNFLPEKDWIMYKDESGEIVPAIVSEKLWADANSVLQKRSNIVKSKKSSEKTNNLYTGLLYCKEHNVPFYKKQNHKNNSENSYDPFWKCSHKINNGSNSCSTFSIYESELKNMLSDIFENLMPNFSSSIDNFITILKSKEVDVKTINSIKSANQKIEQLVIKKDKLLDFSIEGRITDDEFEKRNNQLNDEISTIQKSIDKLEIESKSQDDQIDDLINLKTYIKNNINKTNGELDKTSINKLISRIYISSPSKDKLELEVILNIFGKYDKPIIYDRNTACRSGHTFKKMCPEQHISIERNARSIANHIRHIDFTYYVSV